MTAPAGTHAPTHTRITFSGTFGLTQALEEWAFNLNTGPLQATTAANAKTVATACRGALTTLMSNVMTNDVTLTKTRVAVIDATGHVAKDFDGSYKQGDDLTTYTSANAKSSGWLPLQTALVISLDTARAGATGKGRFFLPFPRFYNLGSDYRLAAADVTALMGFTRTFVNAVATATGAPVVVASGKAAVLSPVTAIRVGAAPDTMRSRRGRLVEAYQRVLL